MFRDSCFDSTKVFQLTGAKYNVKYATVDLNLAEYIPYEKIDASVSFTERIQFNSEDIFASDVERIRGKLTRGN